jgi:hypothetical protein
VTTIRARQSSAAQTAPAVMDLVPVRLRARALSPWSLAGMAAAAASLAALVVFGLDAFGGDIAQPDQAGASVAAGPGTTASVTRAVAAPASPAPSSPLLASAPAVTRPDERTSPAMRLPAGDNRTAVSPLAAPADPRPPAPREPLLKLSPEDIAAHLARGEERLKRGELAAARLYFERVALAGDRRGAHGMARTYDPAVLAGLPILGPQGDAAAARNWYQRAETQRAAR